MCRSPVPVVAIYLMLRICVTQIMKKNTVQLMPLASLMVIVQNVMVTTMLIINIIYVFQITLAFAKGRTKSTVHQTTLVSPPVAVVPTLLALIATNTYVCSQAPAPVAT